MASVIVLILLCFTSFCLGKYTQFVTIKVRTNIANPKFEVEFNEPVEVSAIENEKIYKFTVKNYETDETQNKNVSEVDLEYMIQILSNTDNTVKYELYKDEELIDINEDLVSNYIMMDSEDINEHNYSLKITYEKSDTIDEMADIVEEAKIKIYCKQVEIV